LGALHVFWNNNSPGDKRQIRGDLNPAASLEFLIRSNTL
jgi:hypothetical protein